MRPEPDKDQVTWVGHATCVIDLGRLRAITDPVLRPRVGHLGRWTSIDRDIAEGIDVVLLSHAHHDHLDVPSLRWLAKHTGHELRILAPHGAAEVVERAGVGTVQIVTAGDWVQVDGIDVEIVPALHEGVRAPWVKATGGEEAVGFVLHGDRSVYFPGDTDIFDEMADIGPVDIALLPIGGWWKTLGPGHLNPVRAIDAAKLLQASTVIPIHWGTFRPLGAARLVPELRRDAARSLLAAVEQSDLQAEVIVLENGESYEITSR